tara:strand:+ start:13651 stop:13878 length:228 start_codon:yes stop_codon:yes gene_type:complete
MTTYILLAIIYIAVTTYLLTQTNTNNAVAVALQVLWPLWIVPVVGYLFFLGVWVQLTIWKDEVSIWWNCIDKGDM